MTCRGPSSLSIHEIPAAHSAVIMCVETACLHEVFGGLETQKCCVQAAHYLSLPDFGGVWSVKMLPFDHSVAMTPQSSTFWGASHSKGQSLTSLSASKCGPAKVPRSLQEGPWRGLIWTGTPAQQKRPYCRLLPDLMDGASFLGTFKPL